MTRFAAAALAVCLAAAPSFAQDKAEAQPEKKKLTKKSPPIGHMVYFKLKDSTPESRQKLVAACEKYLADHEGVLFFAAGPISNEFQREVNDRDWDVALHLVFANKAAHDKYQDHPQHQKFIEENKDTWAKVRVFDSELTARGKKKKEADKK